MRPASGESKTRGASFAVVVVLASTVVAGCERPNRLVVEGHYGGGDRLARGLVVILPGIEGQSLANLRIRQALDEGGVRHALTIYDWGFPVPGIGLVVNQTDAGGNRQAGRKLAERIVEYQQEYPHRPVHLIGHSGGGGVAIFVLEALGELPEAEPVSGAILLAASISAGYDLTAALEETDKGIANVYNPGDGVLLYGTGLMGNVDGRRGASAGRVGFRGDWEKLHPVEVTSEDLGGRGLQHFRVTNAEVIRRYGPAWILAEEWPGPTP